MLPAFWRVEWRSFGDDGRIGGELGSVRGVRVQEGGWGSAVDEPHQGGSPGGPCAGGSPADSSRKNYSGMGGAAVEDESFSEKNTALNIKDYFSIKSSSIR
ncbi:uncharacterized protein A4U43_C05F2400 [Asparagus officinalis]|uniref:Uncharacterized protein n=1 Tax=Asparagus officinalis TaxID=4686 RepID=A0A5P1ESH2_ASPOF|nr:uncharacterized protein A4U43_C05F2400 [Asparagus officinalis]